VIIEQPMDSSLISTDKLGLKEYLSYGFADFSQTAAVQFTSLYILFFYTDILMVSATIIGSIFAFSRIWDAINDPIMGMLIDRTSTRFGRCRPYFIPCSVLLALALMLIFSTPDLDGWALIAFIIVSYNLFNMAYTASNLPMTVQLPLLTLDKTERIKLSAVRTFFQALAYAFLPFMVEKVIVQLGGHNSADAYMTVAAGLGVFVIVGFILAFIHTKERVTTKPDPIAWPQLKQVFFSRYDWLIIMSLNILITTGMISRFTSALYHFKYNVGDLAHFGMFMTVLTLSMIPCALAAVYIAPKIGKRNYAIIGCIVGTLGNIVLLYDATSYTSLMLGGLLAGCAGGAFLSVLFAINGDLTDEIETRTGIKAIGVICSAIALGYKAALGLGTAIVGWQLGSAGYIPNVVSQTEQVQQAIDTVFLDLPLITTVISIALLCLYKEKS
jgi:GPH family glycoside/pentoside/hexuronide:cation symporter